MSTKTIQAVQQVDLSNMEDGGCIPESEHRESFKLTLRSDDRPTQYVENTAVHCCFVTPDLMENIFFQSTVVGEADNTLIPADVTHFT